MSKSTSSSVFRKVDVDQYDEDRYVDEEAADPAGDGPNESELMSLMSKDKHKEALLLLLTNAPVGSKNTAVKSKAVSSVLNVLTQFKGDIDQTVKSLDNKNLDMLMKYIYKGFEAPTENSSAVLLTWHQKVFAVGGLGCIMRVMTDRKQV